VLIRIYPRYLSSFGLMRRAAFVRSSNHFRYALCSSSVIVMSPVQMFSKGQFVILER
jgi:hypothetical protein